MIFKRERSFLIKSIAVRTEGYFEGKVYEVIRILIKDLYV